MTADTLPAPVEAGDEALEDAASRETPPCEVRCLRPWEFRKLEAFRRGHVPGHLCGRPSASRVTVHCHGCGARYLLFLCRRHAASFKGDKHLCRACGQEGLCRAAES
jgi:hypothetical protein